MQRRYFSITSPEGLRGFIDLEDNELISEQYEYQALLDESSLLKIPMKLVVHMESAEQRDVRYDVVGLDPLEK